MEAMAPDEMDQDRRQKSGREESEHTAHSQIGAQEQEVRELRQEMSAKEQRISAKEQEMSVKEQRISSKEQEIRELRQEIRAEEQELRAVETELATAPGTEVRSALEGKVQYLRQQIMSLREEIKSCDQQIMSLREEIKSRVQQTRSLREEMKSLRSVQAEGEAIFKKPKRSPAEHPSLDIQTLVISEHLYMWELLAPPPELPVSARDLWEFLSQIRGPLPVRRTKTYRSVKEPGLVKLYSLAEEDVATLVEATLIAGSQRPSNEADSSHILRSVSGDFLCNLNELAPVKLQLLHLESTMDSAKNPGSASAASALVHLMGPDYSLYLRDALVLRWENKIDPADFPLAMEENIQKLKVWSPLYYGELPYVIGGCCGGRNFQWLKLSSNGKKIVAEPISEQYDLWTLGSLVEFLHSVVQMHRLLQRLQEKLTTPVPVRLYKEIVRENGVTVTLGPELVQKTITGMMKGRRDFLRVMYESITGSKYLIQLKGKITVLKGSTKLLLRPIGNPNARPRDLKQLESATHDMLHGLASLHEAGYTHRDLRWQNCILEDVQGERKWIIIDLESAGADGEIWEAEGLVNWDAGTLVGRKRKYTKGSDMYELGKLIVKWLDESGTGVVEENPIRALGKKMVEKRGGAAKMLGDVCSKGCARCAMFMA